MTQRDVERANAAADRRGQRTFDSDEVVAERLNGLIRKPVLSLIEGFFAGEDLPPMNLAIAAVGLFDRGLKNTDRSSPDVGARPIPLDEGNYGVIRDLQLSIAAHCHGGAFTHLHQLLEGHPERRR